MPQPAVWGHFRAALVLLLTAGCYESHQRGDESRSVEHCLPYEALDSSSLPFTRRVLVERVREEGLGGYVYWLWGWPVWSGEGTRLAFTERDALQLVDTMPDCIRRRERFPWTPAQFVLSPSGTVLVGDGVPDGARWVYRDFGGGLLLTETISGTWFPEVLTDTLLLAVPARDSPAVWIDGPRGFEEAWRMDTSALPLGPGEDAALLVFDSVAATPGLETVVFGTRASLESLPGTGLRLDIFSFSQTGGFVRRQLIRGAEIPSLRSVYAAFRVALADTGNVLAVLARSAYDEIGIVAVIRLGPEPGSWTAETIGPFAGPVLDVSLSPSGDRMVIAAGDEEDRSDFAIRLYDLSETGVAEHSVIRPMQDGVPLCVHDAVLARDGRVAVRAALVCDAPLPVVERENEFFFYIYE